MQLFRSEEDVDRWCRATRRPRGATLTASLLQQLAARWYGDRLDPEWRPRTVAESQAILDSLGLVGPAWRLA